jgi:hypothetical protein
MHVARAAQQIMCAEACTLSALADRGIGVDLVHAVAHGRSEQFGQALGFDHREIPLAILITELPQHKGDALTPCPSATAN